MLIKVETLIVSILVLSLLNAQTINLAYSNQIEIHESGKLFNYGGYSFPLTLDGLQDESETQTETIDCTLDTFPSFPVMQNDGYCQTVCAELDCKYECINRNSTKMIDSMSCKDSNCGSPCADSMFCLDSNKVCNVDRFDGISVCFTFIRNVYVVR